MIIFFKILVIGYKCQEIWKTSKDRISTFIAFVMKLESKHSTFYDNAPNFAACTHLKSRDLTLYRTPEWVHKDSCFIKRWLEHLNSNCNWINNIHVYLLNFSSLHPLVHTFWKANICSLSYLAYHCSVEISFCGICLCI